MVLLADVTLVSIVLMKRRDRWHKVLNEEVERWSKKSSAELRTEVKNGIQYEVELESITHQVEIEILEATADYVHVSIAVDDGTLPWSIFPASASFVRKRA
jgi:hypothetical protein